MVAPPVAGAGPAPGDAAGAAGGDGDGAAVRPERRLAALDGIRACAVLAVLLYHGGVSWAGGGLLGVDVFFVLSGFLITGLLCREFAARATIVLRSFWAARLRRLLPGLLILLLGVAAYAHFLSATVDVPSTRGDALASLFYVANWHFILSDQGYFAQSVAPSPLLHTWSLAVEEQYYLVWPLVALFVLGRWGQRALAVTAAAGALASAALMVVLSQAGVSADRLYYGTDTRAQALLVGSLLGAAAVDGRGGWHIFGAPWSRTRRGRRTGALLGAAGGGFLLWAWHALAGLDPFLYHGGFLLVAVAAAAVIATVTSWPHSGLATILSLRPLVFLGRISYGVYLYHWPIFLVVDGTRTGLRGFWLLAVRLLLTLVVATLSWRLVEEPIRRRRWRASWHAVLGTGAVVVGTALTLVVATVGPPAEGSALRVSAQRAGALPAAEAVALRRAHAFGGDPVRFLMFGDSVALTADIGLSDASRQRYGISVFNGGVLGCDLDLGPSRLGGVVYVGRPGVNCGSWPSMWAHQIAAVHPDVVGILIGRFELADHYSGGQWRHLGEPTWDHHLAAELDQAIRIASAHGTRVALFTFPYIDPPLEQADGTPYPENDPSRVDEWNHLLRAAATHFGRAVTLVPLNRTLDPAGHFTDTVSGVQVRYPDDGIHLTVAGAVWLQPLVLPELAQLGLDDRAAHLGRLR